ncbi:Hypothetical protein R9X50_00464800 [Acrodontium crateriforme]|uniref:Uncharacterized protein n=1 Tax=Acrodontium crateriforme TaxID=150365 RepID=A0AAQ3M5Q4_9PEZI|nr:Hypothetical protein R9X50_00464800 [Acrodontium crateriforme]
MTQPTGSQLALLSQLHMIKPGTQIRFLGCVHSYDVQTATLLLRDHYPATTSDVATAAVNVEHVLDDLDHGLSQVGAWLNVIATVVDATRLGHPFFHESDSRARLPNVTFVDASIVWSAGTIKLDQYEATVKAMQATRSAGD